MDHPVYYMGKRKAAKFVVCWFGFRLNSPNEYG